MKIISLCCAAALAASLAVGCNRAHEATSNSGPDRTSLPGTPEANVTPDNDPKPGDFWAAAASGGMAEVELGKLASTKAQNAEVKKFAQMMIADHTKTNEELKALASQKNVALPGGLDSKHQFTMQSLQGLSGEEFDRAYVDAMVKDHEETIRLFQGQANGGIDPDAKGFATKNLPALEKHLQTVKGIREKLQ